MNKKDYDFSKREARQKFYHSKEWKILRNFMLSRQPLCDHCLKKDRITVATEVDHIRDIKDAPELRLSMNNLRTLCQSCHNTKSARDHSESELDLEILNRKWNINVEDFNKKDKQ